MYVILISAFVQVIDHRNRQIHFFMFGRSGYLHQHLPVSFVFLSFPMRGLGHERALGTLWWSIVLPTPISSLLFTTSMLSIKGSGSEFSSKDIVAFLWTRTVRRPTHNASGVISSSWGLDRWTEIKSSICSPATLVELGGSDKCKILYTYRSTLFTMPIALLQWSQSFSDHEGCIKAWLNEYLHSFSIESYCIIYTWNASILRLKLSAKPEIRLYGLIIFDTYLQSFSFVLRDGTFDTRCLTFQCAFVTCRSLSMVLSQG